MKHVELLSPAGNMECLKAAIQNGADAVYVGGKKFGARAFAQNFDYDEMIEAIKYCHLYGAKIYVTVNTICYENETEEALKYVEFLYDNHVDALIMQDIGLIKKVREAFPNMEIHASTQAHNHNDYGLSALKELGVKRVVLARELSLDEVKNLKTDIEKEVFIHGALCVSYSGCCLFSAMHGKRSGNRGECVGSCRLPYTFYENNRKIDTKGDYILSTKSLCTIERLDEILESGVTSLKVEGRMKSSDYVSYITRIYREKIDDYYDKKNIEVKDQEIKNIKSLYNRELTEGYLFNSYGNKLMNIKSSNHIGTHLGKVIKVDNKKIKIKLDDNLYQEDAIRFDNDKGMIINKLYNEKGLLVNKLDKGSIAIIDNKIGLRKADEVRKTIDNNLSKEIKSFSDKKIPIDIYCKAKIGEMLQITIDDYQRTIEKYGSIVEKSINCETDYNRIKTQIEKLGSTPFISNKTTIEMDDNIFVSIKELNEIRRNAIDELIEKREYSTTYTNEKNSIKDNNEKKKDNNLSISILVRNEEQLKEAIKNKVDYIYVTDYNLYKKYKDKNIYFRTKRVANDSLDYNNENILATELGAVYKYSKDNNVNTDYFLNVVNKSSINYLKSIGAKRVTLSPEIDKENLKLLNNINNIDIFIYGRVELMITKYCPMNMLINKDNKNCKLCDINKYSLKDKDNNIYPLINDKHLTHILDCKNFNLLDDIDELIDMDLNSFRIDLYDEKTLEINNIIKNIRNAYDRRNNK